MSKGCFRVILMAICSALLVAAVQAQSASPPPAARNYPIAEWKTFTSDAWKFSALMPTKPKEETSVEGNVKRRTFDSFMSQHTFLIDCYESDSESASLEFATTNVRNSYLRSGTAKLLRDEKINLGSYEGREMAIAITRSFKYGSTDDLATTKSVVQIRVFAVGRRVYLLIAKSLNREAETKEAQAFLDSFKLLSADQGKRSGQPNSNNR